MTSIAAQLANLISAILSGGIAHLVGSPGQIGEEFKTFLDEIAAEIKELGLRDAIRSAGPLIQRSSPVAVYIAAVAFLIVATFSYWVFWFHKGWREELVLWTLFLGILIACFPLISRAGLQRWLSPPKLAITEIAVLATSLSLFVTIALKLPLYHSWLFYTTGLIMLLVGGGRWVELVHAQTKKVLLQEWSTQRRRPANDGPCRNDVEQQLDAIKKHFRWELVCYSALPLGIPIGLFFGHRYGGSAVEIITTCLQWIFGLACIFLSYFLLISCHRMSCPTLRLDFPSINKLRDGSDSARDWGCVLTAYRKMFLADIIENTALLITFFLLTWLLHGAHTLPMILGKFLIGVVVGSIILNELPYLIGQWRVQEALVVPYKGWEKMAKMKEVAENIALIPKFEWLAALVGEASAGGLAIEVMKKIAELTAKPQ